MSLIRNRRDTGWIGTYGNDAQMAQSNLKADRYPYVGGMSHCNLLKRFALLSFETRYFGYVVSKKT